MKKTWLFVLLFSSLMLPLAEAQEKDPARNAADRIAPKDLAADLDILYDALKTTHPRYNQYASPAAFDSVYQSKKSWILAQKDSISNGNAYLQLTQLAGMIRDGHTYFVKSLKKTNFTEPKAELMFLSGKYYLIDVAPEDTALYYMAQCTHINGSSLDSMFKAFERIRTGDGYNTTFPSRIFGLSVFYYYQAMFGPVDTWQLACIGKEGQALTFTSKGKKMFLTKEEAKAEKEKEKQKTEKKSVARDSTKNESKDIVLFKAKSAAKLYRSKLDTSVVVMSINTFSYPRYSRFYRKSFKYLRKHNPRMFIVDVRENLGGSVSNVGDLTSYLLDSNYVWHVARKKNVIHSSNNQSFFGRMMVKKVMLFKKVKRDGETVSLDYKFKQKPKRKKYDPKKLVVLQNSFTFSGGSVTASVLQNLCGATAIGNETGGAEFDFNALVSQRIELPNSKMQLLIAAYSIDMDMGQPNNGRGVIPDYLTLPTVQDVLAKRDVMLQRAIELK